MATIYDKPGTGWDKINPDNCFTSYFKTNEMGDVVQQEKNLQHHNWCCLRVFVSLDTEKSGKNCFVFS
jgi:hypothetical protein